MSGRGRVRLGPNLKFDRSTLIAACYLRAKLWGLAQFVGGPTCLGRDRDTLVILLAGGTKARQHQDIKNALDLWREYKRSKHGEV